MSQGDLGAIGHIEGLSFGEGSQTSLTKKEEMFNIYMMLSSEVSMVRVFLFLSYNCFILEANISIPLD